MAKLRHLALATNNPRETAEFYKQAFGFQEVGRVDLDLAHGVYLSDGTLNLAILKFKNVDQIGRGLDYVGLHHIGIVVDDVKQTGQKLEELGAPCFMGKTEDALSFYEIKHRGPDGVVIDISDHPWLGSAGLEDKPAVLPG